MLASTRNIGGPINEFNYIGFRIASIPEPSTLLLGAIATVGLLMRRPRWN
ncbi:MAG: PEP-CTERM sorting domain-containing protein [Pirellulales bacterium]